MKTYYNLQQDHVAAQHVTAVLLGPAESVTRAISSTSFKLAIGNIWTPSQ
jgi:hypothetical protein